MGQYRQWLHLREVDQKLHTQLAILEQELAQLQEQARLLLADDYATDNTILQALSRQLTPSQAHQQQYPSVPAPTRNGNTAQHAISSATWATVSPEAEQLSESISPALFGWSQLPNFDAWHIQQPPPSTHTSRPVPPTPRIEDLLPEDVTSFVDEHTNAAPSQIKLPWWFNNTLPATKGPVDQQSVRTDRLVQRWLERWRKPESQSTQKDQVR